MAVFSDDFPAKAKKTQKNTKKSKKGKTNVRESKRKLILLSLWKCFCIGWDKHY
jgi:hypothetical protein